MGATSTEKLSYKVALHGLPDGDYAPSRSGRYSGYKIQFGAADEGKPLRRFIWEDLVTVTLADRAHACLNLYVTNNIAPYNTLFVFRPPQAQREEDFSLFCIGTGVRHITVFLQTQERSQVFNILAGFGSVSFLYPDQYFKYAKSRLKNKR